MELSGVGGIGKSRLLHELRRRVPEDVSTAQLNFQEPAQRSSLAALGTLRSQFSQSRIKFDRFDIAYAVWWQRLNPLVALSEKRLPWAAESEVLVDVMDAFAGLPIFSNSVKILDFAAKRFSRWNAIRYDQTLQDLDELSLDQLGDAVTYLFANDLDRHGRYVVLIDAYEALAGGVSRQGMMAQDIAWFRDLLGQLDRGLTVIASREPVGWARRDPEWTGRIRSIPVVALPYRARLELLDALGVHDPAQGQAIATDCDGVPYFLHLAREAGSSVSAYARIEERFLNHVAPEMVKVLELLSVARFFDRDIFRQITRHYELRGDAQAWETLIAYSFIAEAGPDSLQIHQLMARAIQARLSSAVLDELHALLRDIWLDRARQAHSVTAWREAAFHAACTHPSDTTSLIMYADALASAGKPGLDNMRTDLVGVDRHKRYHKLTRLLDAEASLLVGDAPHAHSALGVVSMSLDSSADEIDARVALAAANAERILGNTAAALKRYAEVWPDYPGPARLDAGLWHADLDMAQGRFVDAIATADAVEQASAPDQAALRGDLARLRCLAHRFAFDHVGAVTHAQAARAAYAAAGHEVGLANISINEAEILAVIEPVAAVARATQAIEMQRQLGADHEVGKGLTALALAHLRLGKLGATEQVLDEAMDVLERCGYRSGRARAELIRALWHARAVRIDQAASSAVWAVAEFEKVEVYPTMILLAGALLDRIGRPEPSVSAAVVRAERAIQPLHDFNQLESTIRNVVSQVVADDWDRVYEAAVRGGSSITGFYHNNVRVGTNLVRMAISGADSMDLRIWPEPPVLAAVGRRINCVPALRSVSKRPAYQIHEWIEGEVLNDFAPKGTRVPEGAIDQLAAFFGALGAVPLAELPPVPDDWPAAGDSAGFAARLFAVTTNVYRTFHDEYAGLWRALGIPDDPFQALELHALNPRPFWLVHSDVHRQNIIVKGDGTCIFVDWELALAGDPVYEIAVHLHKMAYQPDEDDAMRRAWASACEADRWPEWSVDLQRYLAHERVKSAIVDSVRYAKVVSMNPGQLNVRAANLAQKLKAARAVWQDLRPVDVNEIGALLAMLP
ncbi:MAG: phosphotransferase family protein [Kineosporiaceae bacterium]